MKIEILRDNFNNGLSVAQRVVGRNLSLPILDNVLIDANDGFLNITSTNLETTIKIWILSKIIKTGKALVPAKVLLSYISFLPNEKISIEAKDNNLFIDSQNSKTQIQGFNIDDYPIIPDFKQENCLKINNEKFISGLLQVVDIASLSQSRPEISGVYFIFSQNNLKIVATDSFRLAEKSITLPVAVKKDFSFIMPQKPAKEIIGILEAKEGDLQICFSDNQVLLDFPMKEVSHSQVQIISRLIEGEYPNYQDIIPTKFKTTAT